MPVPRLDHHRRLKKEPRPTPRQVEIIRLAAQGLSYAEIGNKIGISHQTVRNHMSLTPTGLYRRIGASSQCHALAILIRDGYIATEEL